MKSTTNTVADLHQHIISRFNPECGFTHLSSPSLDFTHATTTYHSPFFLALILKNLVLAQKNNHFLTDDKAIDVIAHLLYEQKSNFWSYNYWFRESAESHNKPYPDDLDDTFAALCALHCYDATLFNGSALAKITQTLTFCEVAEGGPYRTWVVPPEAKQHWKDVDPFVNAHIGLFLSYLDIELPRLTEFIEEKIHASLFSSQYYPSVLPGMLFLLEWYHGDYREQLIQLVEKNYRNFSKLEQIIFFLSLDNSEVQRFSDAIVSLRKEIIETSDVFKKPYAFCLDPAQNGTKFYAGSSELTASFALRFLCRFSAEEKKIRLSLPHDEQEIISDTIALIDQLFKNQTHLIRQSCTDFIHHFQKKRSFEEVFLLPYRFSKALSLSIPKEKTTKLCAASVLGWISYTLFDNAMDGEKNAAQKLPLAFASHRIMTSIFLTTINKPAFDHTFEFIMNRLDEAQAWEMAMARKKILGADCRDFFCFRNTDQIGHKSYGHMLSCVGQLFLDEKYNITTTHAFITFFHHYLIARQLNDDAHDVREDLEAGHISFVVSKILMDFPEHSCFILSETLLDELHKKYWKTTSIEIADLILHHANKARDSLAYVHDIIIDMKFFTDLIKSVERGAISMKEERQKAFDFIREF